MIWKWLKQQLPASACETGGKDSWQSEVGPGAGSVEQTDAEATSMSQIHRDPLVLGNQHGDLGQP